MWKDRKKYGGILKWAGGDDVQVTTAYFRAGFIFAVLGFSGLLPYFGELAGELGGDIFDGNGVYRSTTWATWYKGGGYVEFISYMSWLTFGLYFLVRAAMAKKSVAPKVEMAAPKEPEA